MSTSSATPKLEELRNALSAMVIKITPDTSKAQIANLLADVEAAQAKGFTRKQIYETLKEAGLDMTFATFTHNLHLVRKNQKTT